jgi:serine protease
MQSNILKLVSFSIVSATIALPIPSPISPVIAQPVQDEGIYYLYQGQKIYLTAQPNTIAIEFKTPTRTVREIGEDDRPPYLKLETELQKSVSVRGTKPLTVTPIGTNLALINIPPELNNARNLITKRSIAQSFVKQSFPVLTRSGTAENLVVTNELLVSFAADVPDTKRQEILKTQNLEIVRPLRFTENHYIVRSTTTSGTGLLKVGNTLRGLQGITAVSPNFIQSIAEPPSRVLPEASPRSIPSGNTDRAIPNALRSDLLPLQWHLDSRSQYPDSPRVDVRAKEAWTAGRKGKGVVVAVLDSLIQWDHPNLVNSILSTATDPSALKDEAFGWDFENDDPDTRISPNELSVLLPDFQKAFKKPGEGNLGRVVGSFHGTMTSSAVAAKAVNGKGIFGIAPEAKILPVKVGMSGPVSAAIAEAIPYAAKRGADVISMSFGGSVPNEVYTDILKETLAKYPKLVMVASAGNEDTAQSGYPAGTPGVISVGAIGPTGYRSSYSNFGIGLDVVAPGGDLQSSKREGFLVTGGTFVSAFWKGLTMPQRPWGLAEDPRGQYVWTQGTSFSAPLVAGVVALMKSEDPDRKLSRDQIITLLRSTASTQEVLVSEAEKSFLSKLPKQNPLTKLTPKQALFGFGLVNAELAVQETQKAVKQMP